jgi:hypothetical protein
MANSTMNSRFVMVRLDQFAAIERNFTSSRHLLGKPAANACGTRMMCCPPDDH